MIRVDPQFASGIVFFPPPAVVSNVMLRRRRNGDARQARCHRVLVLLCGNRAGSAEGRPRPPIRNRSARVAVMRRLARLVQPLRASRLPSARLSPASSLVSSSASRPIGCLGVDVATPHDR